MTVNFSHATGFCGAVWDPVVTAVEADSFTWDHPGHGRGPSLAPPIDWRVFGEFVLEVVEPGGVGVGHSMGAAALAMAQAVDPSRFAALVLIEPIVYPGPYERRENPMTEVALRRRREFPSREAAADNFRDRGAFAGWAEEAFDGYIRCGLQGDDPVTLACDPEVEADVYRGSGAHDTWDLLGSIDIPVLVLSGEESDTISPEFARAQADRFPRAGVEVVPGAGHFLPMEKPALIAARVNRLVAALADQP